MSPDELIIHNLCTQGYHLIEHFLDPVHCQKLKEIAREMYIQGAFRSAKIGLNLETHNNKAIRTDEIFWINEEETHPALHAYLDKMNDLMQIINQSLFLSLQEFETHFAAYQPGTFYQKHVDQFAKQKTRKISCVYYLNNEWQNEYGGELKLYDQHNQLIQVVYPKENHFICFNSELPHEVCYTHQPRYSITGWMKTRSEFHKLY